MNRNILLVEPGYKTKFPPLGLMKISTYHKSLGDSVSFVKGINEDLAYQAYWDRIYVSTVFTYNWDITIKTIKFYKYLVKDDLSRIIVGGIMASLMSKQIWEATGIVPIQGILSSPGILDSDNEIIVDALIPDYDLFTGSSLEYSLIKDSYFGYSTRGCLNKCKFCGVHILEPQFVEYEGLKPYVDGIKECFGEKNNLVLFDNNILASKKLPLIIKDIMDIGIFNGSKLNNKARYVDFNQGVDARLLNESKMKLLSQIPINPLRIAFDSIKYEKIYCDKIKLAAKYNLTRLSNYILYNWNDTPVELWKRLKINILLNEKFDLKIYSFPMKYIPLMAIDRTYISVNWNWQFIRSVQRILNVVKGIVMPGVEFFNRAFGETENEFIEILHMPESILMHRTKSPLPEEMDWKNKYRGLTDNEKNELVLILSNNRKKNELISVLGSIKNQKLKNILEYYVPNMSSSSNSNFFI